MAEPRFWARPGDDTYYLDFNKNNAIATCDCFLIVFGFYNNSMSEANTLLIRAKRGFFLQKKALISQG
jgi:hypothetical protein